MKSYLLCPELNFVLGYISTGYQPLVLFVYEPYTRHIRPLTPDEKKIARQRGFQLSSCQYFLSGDTEFIIELSRFGPRAILRNMTTGIRPLTERDKEDALKLGLIVDKPSAQKARAQESSLSSGSSSDSSEDGEDESGDEEESESEEESGDEEESESEDESESEEESEWEDEEGEDSSSDSTSSEESSWSEVEETSAEKEDTPRTTIIQLPGTDLNIECVGDGDILISTEKKYLIVKHNGIPKIVGKTIGDELIPLTDEEIMEISIDNYAPNF